ncbi:nucleolin-like [Dorcoceras hygrometricum]|uniref:Nucleolin-like n=1 Tax=Dorcoceras hygrometricum TaxID=472368 RepID=A0A2Z7BBE5_9LAMI|nr:nucleolin-like [Dorcoceras hygrometricum]
MAGGGNRRTEGSLTASNTNVFAALDSLRKKKKSDKERGSSKGVAKAALGKSKDAEDKPQVYWAPTPLTVKSWADVDDEDDDDYYATTAPPQAIWAGSGPNKAEEMQQLDPVEESESEDELLIEGDDDVEEEPEIDAEVPAHTESITKIPVEHSPAPKEAERQLSKKEMKKKELAELDALLADFGISQKEKAEDELADATREKKDGQLNEAAEKKENAPAESKSAKKKKKRDRVAKEVKEPQDQPQHDGSDFPNGQESNTVAQEVEEDASAVDLKERLKKVASSKKKKSSKDVDAAARAASAEAAARSARLAAAKKKEKSHYNQQPIR